MKMSLKKVLAAVFALTFLAACFTACGSKGTGSSSSDGKTLKIGSSGRLTATRQLTVLPLKTVYSLLLTKLTLQAA